VDGADFNNPSSGSSAAAAAAFTFNLDAVQELVVVAGGANAEFGRSSGGFVNVITKSGRTICGHAALLRQVRPDLGLASAHVPDWRGHDVRA